MSKRANANPILRKFNRAVAPLLAKIRRRCRKPIASDIFLLCHDGARAGELIEEFNRTGIYVSYRSVRPGDRVGRYGDIIFRLRTNPLIKKAHGRVLSAKEVRAGPGRLNSFPLGISGLRRVVCPLKSDPP